MPLQMTDIGASHQHFGADGIGFKAITGWATHQFFVPRDVLEHLGGEQGDSPIDSRKLFDQFADRIGQAAQKAAKAAGITQPGQGGAYIMLKPSDFD